MTAIRWRQSKGGAKIGEHRADRITRQVERLFHSASDGYGARDYLVDHDGLFGAFFQRAFRYRITHLPRASVAFGLAQRYHPSVNEGATHFAMKRAAIDWMRTCGASDAAEEVSWAGGRADAYSGQKRWVVECGSARLGKLSSALHSPEPTRFTLIPYQTMHLPDDRPKRLLAIDFLWSPHLSAAVYEYVAEINRLRRVSA